MMKHKYILLLVWFIGMILFVGGLYMQEARANKRNLWKAVSTVGAAATAFALTNVLIAIINSI